jgi:hypothetical protein
VTDFVRPSDGRTTSRPHIDMNRRRLKEGERIVYQSGLGGHQAGAIDEISPYANGVRVGVEYIGHAKILGRIPEAFTDEQIAYVLEALNVAEKLRDTIRAEAWTDWERNQAKILKAAGIR